MEADTGQIRALASLPDFDPNLRPPLPTQGDPADSPLFNRAAQGRYELGSVFKPFTVAMALEAGLVGPQTLVDTKSPDALRALHHPRLPQLRAAADGRGRAGEVVEHRRRAYRHRCSAPRGSRRSSTGSGCSTASPVELTEAGRTAPLAAGALDRPLDDHHLLRPRHGGDAAASRRRATPRWSTAASGCGRASSPATRRPSEADRVISARTSRAAARDAAAGGGARHRRGPPTSRATRSAARPAPPTSRTPGAATRATRRSRPSPRSSRRRAPKYVLVVMPRRADGDHQQDLVPHRRPDRGAGARRMRSGGWRR